MKRFSKWSCFLIFLLLCIFTIGFLQNFTKEEPIQYIEWQTAAKLAPDGSETSLSPEDALTPPKINDTYRFSTNLPPNLKEGHLIFETSGLNLTLTLNDEQIWQSSAKTPEGALNLTQAVIPLPENATGELVMTCIVESENDTMFPPLPRFESMSAVEQNAYAYANHYGIPAGASAVLMLLIAGLFLLGILRQQLNWSLIPLFLAALGLTVRWISQGLGFYFLPEPLVRILSLNGIGILTFLMLVIFLFMNRQKEFRRCFGMVAVGSFLVLVICTLISFANDGYLSYFLQLQIESLLQTGYYDGLLYWLTVWMTAVCTLISAYAIIQSFAKQQTEAQMLNLKNQLIMNSYRTIETKMRDSAELRHEINHRIVAMDALYQKGDYQALGQLLDDMKSKIGQQTLFSKHFTINAILQDAASRAAQAGISFQAKTKVPETIPIPENDLCELLMNMLDNAIEAAEQVKPPQRSFIRFRAEVKNDFLAVKCENSYTGTIPENKQHRLMTQKPDPEAHGLGMKLMSAVAGRYRSLLDFSYSEDHVFTIQTVLKFPK